MSNSYIVNLERLYEGGTYGENLWRAFRIFLAALLGDRPAVQQSRSEREKERMESMEEIYRLARHFDNTMPNQAAELRDLAARGPRE